MTEVSLAVLIGLALGDKFVWVYNKTGLRLMAFLIEEDLQPNITNIVLSTNTPLQYFLCLTTTF